MATSTAAVAEITDLSASELARQIASRELSAALVVEVHLRRIEAVNPRLNALIVPLFDQARADARAADAARDRGEPLGPLHGVPVTVKEMFDVAGTPSTLGIPGWAERLATADAPLVGRLRKAGGILLGKTNVPQLGMLFETDNPLYGRTNNPWNPARAPGGSTGGEAALVAARASPLGLGSDGGGSIRQPSHCCGINGLKPTAGRLSMRGHVGLPNWARTWVQPGPLARCVADLALALKVLAAPGQEAFDPDIAPAPLGDPAAVALGGLRVGVYTDDGFFPAAPALRRAVREAADALRQQGVQVADFRPPDVWEAWGIYFRLFSADGLRFMRHCLGKGLRDWRVHKILSGARLPRATRPALAWMLERRGRRYEAGFLRCFSGRPLPVGAYWRLLDEQTAYRDCFLRALDAGGIDALLCPPSGLPALTHGCYFGGVAGSYALLYNLLGMPAGVVAATRVRPGEESDRPAGKDPVSLAVRDVERGSTGLPVGVQVAARHWREDVVLAVMAALEHHFRKQPDYPARPPLD